MKRTTIAAIVGVVAIFVAACSPAITVGVSSASSIKPRAYHTYTWVLADAFPVGDPRLDNNPFFVSALKASVAGELKRLGLEEGDANADLTVHFHAAVQRALDVYDVDRRAGYDQAGYERVPQVRQYDLGTVLVDISDRPEKRVIWRGWMQADLSDAIGNDALLAERVRKGMRQLFERFPAQCVDVGK